MVHRQDDTSFVLENMFESLEFLPRRGLLTKEDLDHAEVDAPGQLTPTRLVVRCSNPVVDAESLRVFEMIRRVLCVIGGGPVAIV